MDRHTVRFCALVGLASLVTSPTSRISAATLREEAVTYRIQGYEAQRRGDLVSATTLYQKAVALDPTYPAPHNDLGVLLEQEGRLEEAERAYQQALALDPDYLVAHANLAMLYERMGEKENAIGHWMTRYQKGDPSDPWTNRAKERLVAFGALDASAGLGGGFRRAAADEVQAHTKSIEEFHAVTEEHGDWP